MRARVPALCVLLLATSARAGDLVVRQRVSGTGPADTSREETQYWTATTRVTDASDHRLVIDITARTMMVADKAKKTYHVVTFDQIRGQTEQLRRQLDQLPPEARKHIPNLDADVTVTPTGRRETIAGHPAQEHAVTSGIASGHVWVTDALALPGDPKVWRDAMDAMSGPNAPGGKLASAMAKLNGVPLRSVLTTNSPIGKSFTSTTEALEIRAASPPDGMAAPPAGFTKVDAPGMSR